MAGKASATLDTMLLKELKSLSKARRVSPEKLLNSAVRAYLRGAKTQERETRELTAAANALTTYRQRAPGFEKAIEVFVTAEAGGATADPAEGRPVRASRRLRVPLEAILHG